MLLSSGQCCYAAFTPEAIVAGVAVRIVPSGLTSLIHSLCSKMLIS